MLCHCSFLELYNEETTDLLAVGQRQDQKLRIMEDRSGVVIQASCCVPKAFISQIMEIDNG